MGGLSSIINTAVTGATAQSAALGVVSDNIANSQTIGYKNTVSRFGSLVAGGRDVADLPGTTGSARGGGGASYVASGVSHGSGVTGKAMQMVGEQGVLQSTGNNANLALAGRGFFEVRKLSNIANNTAESYFTRAGDFSVDKDGYLVNSAGFALLGVVNPEPQDKKNLSFDQKKDDPQAAAQPVGKIVPVKITPNGEIIPGAATTSVAMSVNIPANSYMRQATVIPERGNSGTVVEAVDGDTLESIQAKYPNRQITAGKESYSAISARDGKLIAGDRLIVEPPITNIVSVPIYGTSGSVYNVELEYRKVFPASATSSDWEVRIKQVTDSDGLVLYGPSVEDGGAVKPVLGGPTEAQPIAFDSKGQVVGSGSLSFGPLPLNGADSLNTTFDMKKVTQTGEQSYVGAITSNGRPAGARSGLEITDDGYVVETFSNGVRRNVYRLPIADFRNPEGLERESGTVWAESPASGIKRSGWPKENGVGALSSGSLESSTTDLASEFSTMILTQRAYSANLKVVSTGDEMYQEAIQIKR